MQPAATKTPTRSSPIATPIAATTVPRALSEPGDAASTPVPGGGEGEEEGGGGKGEAESGSGDGEGEGEREGGGGKGEAESGSGDGEAEGGAPVPVPGGGSGAKLSKKAQIAAAAKDGGRCPFDVGHHTTGNSASQSSYSTHASGPMATLVSAQLLATCQ